MQISPHNISIQEYWILVRQQEASLSEDFYHVTGKGGVMLATRNRTARALVEKSHTISTPEEIAAFERDQVSRAEQIRNAEARRNPNSVLPDILAGLMARQSPAGSGGNAPGEGQAASVNPGQPNTKGK